MVIDNLHIEGVTAFESKTYAPLIIDSNAPLPFAIMLQWLQAIREREAQIVQRRGRIELDKSHRRPFPDLRR